MEADDKGKRWKSKRFKEKVVMSKFSVKGYFVKVNAYVYLTMDMDRTAQWFEHLQ